MRICLQKLLKQLSEIPVIYKIIYNNNRHKDNLSCPFTDKRAIKTVLW